ncbi:hypothetical protein DPM35_24735 [Mesorhizobium atlanticum]|uniref:Uncharacterized protein n=1 Tax=Mesorhizobium atlanticum TaxID=2233532 RepID=A0A330GPR7_9HYPH|nr:hypothetical protein DPM35_24735 [Mesorhizobium atlanticum]
MASLSVLPDISPSWGEIGSFGDGAHLATSAIGEGRGDGQSPLKGEMSGRTVRGAKELDVSVEAPLTNPSPPCRNCRCASHRTPPGNHRSQSGG